MAWQFPTSSTTSAINVNLGTTDSVYVGSNVSIASINQQAIYGTGSYHEAYIDGSVAGPYGVYLGDDLTVDHNQLVTISDIGRVFSTSYGVVLLGYDSDVINEGRITSKYIGIYFGGASTTTQSTIENSGKISSTTYGIYSAGTEANLLHNTGTISGGTYSFVEANVSNNTIDNDGKMIGNISLGAGNDYYDGRNGSIVGEVLGGAGADKLYGGAENNVLRGGTENDRIFGVGGADKLYGDAGADTFIYQNIKESTASSAGRDTIYDFSHAELDKIDLHTIDANTLVSGNQAFKFIGSAAFTHHAGELQDYSSSSGHFIRGDVNGDGTADFVVQIDTNNVFVTSDFIL